MGGLQPRRRSYPLIMGAPYCGTRNVRLNEFIFMSAQLPADSRIRTHPFA